MIYDKKYKKKKLVGFTVGSGSSFYGGFPFTAKLPAFDETEGVVLTIKHGSSEYSKNEIEEIIQGLGEITDSPKEASK